MKSYAMSRCSGPLKAIVAGIILTASVTAACAVHPDEVLKDANLEARARALSAQLRCLVCQNQSIDDSDAPLARDLRLLVRERLTAGDSDVAVKSFVVARYGEFVLLRPPFGWSTLLLWLGPFAVLISAAYVVFRKVRQPYLGAVTGATGTELSDDEEARLARLIETGSDRLPSGRG